MRSREERLRRLRDHILSAEAEAAALLIQDQACREALLRALDALTAAKDEVARLVDPR